MQERGAVLAAVGVPEILPPSGVAGHNEDASLVTYISLSVPANAGRTGMP